MTSPAKRFPTFAWGVLIYNLAVIAWGAVVRITGSGDGCGSHWPLCNGEVVPLDASIETRIEFAHRATSGLAGLLVLALLIWALRAYGRGHPARLGAVASSVFLLAEAGLGAGLVRFGLVAENESMERAFVMMAHLANTFLLVAFLALTAYWAGGGKPVRLRGQGPRLRGPAAALLGTLLLGMSGAVAALGDTLYPATSLREAVEQNLAPGSQLLLQLRLLHPLIAVVVGLMLVLVAGRVRAAGQPAARRFADALFVLVFVQLAAGALNYVLKAPLWMQVVHLMLADFLWISLVLTAAASLAAPREAEVPVPSPRGDAKEGALAEA